MYDSIEMQLVNPRLKPEHELLTMDCFVDPSGKTNRGVTLNYEHGEEVTYGRVYFQDRDFRLRSVGNVIRVEFSLAKLASRDRRNIAPPTQAAAVEAVNYLEKILAIRCGLLVDPCQALLLRCDVFCNAKTRRPMVEYGPLINTFVLPHMKTVDYHGTGYSFYNSEEAISIYDKLVQAGIQGTDPSEHLLRWEWRSKSPERIRQNLGVATLGELVDNYDDIKARYYAHVRHVLRYEEVTPSVTDVPGLTGDVSVLMKKPKDTKALISLLEAYGAHQLIGKLGDVGSVKELLASRGYTRGQQNRFIERLQRGLDAPLSGENGAVPINELKMDLYSGLVAGVQQ